MSNQVRDSYISVAVDFHIHVCEKGSLTDMSELSLSVCAVWAGRLGSRALSAGDLSLPCRRVCRRAIHFLFAGANHQAGFSHWCAIGWFNTMTGSDGKQPIAYRVI